MQRYEIADMFIEILPDKQMTFKKYDPFITNKSGKPDLKIHIEFCNAIIKPKGKLLIDETIKWQYKSETENIMVVYICEKATDKILFLCEIDEKWENAIIYYSGEECEVEREVTGILGSILFRNSVLFHQGFVIHASAIEWNGKGILFSAPSETGKSTQAKLWMDNMGAKILNDDTPCVRSLNGQNYVYGTPWSGSSNKFLNEGAPISAIVILNQSKENRIKRLAIHESVTMLMPRCFLPYYDNNIMNIAINNFEKVISSIPVYFLECRPDMEAVELVYGCVI